MGLKLLSISDPTLMFLILLCFRLTGYVLFKVFSNLFMSVTVHGGQQEAIERAAQRDTPIIYLPLHRSHVDYLFVTWVLFNKQIPAPIVAAGDNLRIPIFGCVKSVFNEWCELEIQCWYDVSVGPTL